MSIQEAALYGDLVVALRDYAQGNWPTVRPIWTRKPPAAGWTSLSARGFSRRSGSYTALPRARSSGASSWARAIPFPGNTPQRRMATAIARSAR